jgi:4'-phosphopantetheinyl transferase
MKTTLLEQEHYRILIAEIPESVEELIPQLINFNDYENEFKQINASKRKKEYISVRFLMNILMQKNVIIAYDNVHKPYLPALDYSISISHSGSYYAIIASETSVAGIDIECRTNRVERVRERYLDQQELGFLHTPGDTRWLEIAWSVKEALYKCIGRESYDFHTLKIQTFEQKDQGSCRVVFAPANREFKVYYMQTESYTIAYSI